MDKSNLDATPSLWGSITNAIQNSSYLILLASPESAKSKWVNKEIQQWLLLHSPQTIIIVRIGGEIRWNGDDNDFDYNYSSSIPEGLKGRLNTEPLIIDLIESKETSNDDFQLGIAKVSARIRGVSIDTIIGEHIHRKKQTRFLIILTSVILFGLILSSGMLYVRKNKESRIAVSREFAARAQTALKDYDYEKALANAVKAFDLDETNEAMGSLIDVLVATQHLVLDVAVSNYMIDFLAIDPKKKFFVAGDQTGLVAFYDLNTGRVIKKYDGVHSGNGVHSISVSSDGSRVITAGGENEKLIVWNTTSFGVEFAFDKVSCNTSVFLPGDSVILIGGDSGSVTSLNLNSRKITKRHLIRVDGLLTDIAVQRQGKWFVTGSLFGVVRIRDITTLESLNVIDPDPSTGTHVDISRDGTFLIMSGGGAIQTWDLKQNESYGDPFVAAGSLDIAKYLPEPHNPILMIMENTLTRWSYGREHQLIGFHKSEIVSFDYDATGRLAATGAKDGHVRIWSMLPDNPFVKVIELTEDDLSPNVVALSANGNQVAWISSNYRFNLASGQWHSNQVVIDYLTRSGRDRLLEGQEKMIFDLEISAEGFLASGGNDGRLRLWNLSSGASMNIESPKDSSVIHDISFSKSGNFLACLRENQNIEIFDLVNHTKIEIPTSLKASSISFTERSQDFLIGTFDGKVLRWSDNKVDTVFSTDDSENAISSILYNHETRSILFIQKGKPHLFSLSSGRYTDLKGGSNSRSVASGGKFGYVLDVNSQLSIWDLTNTVIHISNLNKGSADLFVPVPKNVRCSTDGLKVIATIPPGLAIFSLDEMSMFARVNQLSPVNEKN